MSRLVNLDEERLKLYIESLSDNYCLLLVGRAISQSFLTFASEVAARILNVPVEIESLPYNLVPAASWVCLDGTINGCLIAAIAFRIISLTQEQSGSTIDGVSTYCLGYIF